MTNRIAKFRVGEAVEGYFGCGRIVTCHDRGDGFGFHYLVNDIWRGENGLNPLSINLSQYYTRTNWTAHEVRVGAELPKVPIEYNGQIFIGRTTNRTNPKFATVWFKDGTQNEIHFEFAWRTIANALNKQKPLKT